jgi:hypothetical protein
VREHITAARSARRSRPARKDAPRRPPEGADLPRGFGLSAPFARYLRIFGPPGAPSAKNRALLPL